MKHDRRNDIRNSPTTEGWAPIPGTDLILYAEKDVLSGDSVYIGVADEGRRFGDRTLIRVPWRDAVELAQWILAQQRKQGIVMMEVVDDDGRRTRRSWGAPAPLRR